MKQILFSFGALLLLMLIITSSTPRPVHAGIHRDWSVIEKELIELGVIDKARWSPELETSLNILWALGLANKNPILEYGPMADPRYGGTERFASTGGWSLAVGNTMDHYSMHELVMLTSEQQELVERVSKNIYRPCCDNPAYFPDCNHGMAMLALLEIMASEDANEKELYAAAKEANGEWFPWQTNSSCGV